MHLRFDDVGRAVRACGGGVEVRFSLVEKVESREIAKDGFHAVRSLRGDASASKKACRFNRRVNILKHEIRIDVIK
jgi:hypothetical protein